MTTRRRIQVLGLLLFIFALAGCQPGQFDLSQLHPVGETGNALDTAFDLSALMAAAGVGGGAGAYTSEVSVAPGESIDFHISNGRSGAYSVQLYREGDTRELVDTVTGVRTNNYGCNGKYATGCDWPVAFSYTIPNSWKSGVYTADIPQASGKAVKTIFWVREKNPGSQSKVLFLSSVNTYHAYNNYAGGSLYSAGGKKSPMVTFDRPYKNGVGLFSRWEQYFVTWAEQEGYELEYATTYDLAFDPDLLSHYDVAIIAGHSEYWSWEMRDQVKQFIADGGRFMNLSGNTMWWQVRFEDNGRTMIGYKDWRKDPETAQEVATDLTWDYPIFDNPISLIGLHYPFGGFPGKSGDGYTVVNADHWIYDGTGLRENDFYGKGPNRNTSIHDKESDGTALNCAADGYTILGAPGRNMSPENFKVLGIVPVLSKQRKMSSYGEMGLYTLPGGGAVFSAGATGWVTALGQREVATITANVLDRFISGNFPQEPSNPDADYLFYDRFNCNDIARGRFSDATAKDVVRLNYTLWAGTEGDKFTNACGVDGSGLEVRATASRKGHRFGNSINADWSGVNNLYTRVYLDLGDLNLGNGAVVTVIEQYDDDRVSTLRPAAELQISQQGNQLVARYQPAGADLPWVPVPNRGFWLETEWDKSAGEVSLWIDGDRTTENVAMNGRPALNRFDFGVLYKSGSVGGSFCMDELAYNDAPRP